MLRRVLIVLIILAMVFSIASVRTHSESEARANSPAFWETSFGGWLFAAFGAFALFFILWFVLLPNHWGTLDF